MRSAIQKNAFIVVARCHAIGWRTPVADWSEKAAAHWCISIRF
jgi:hypothetical protein